MNERRVPAGVPSGGQFAEQAKNESSCDLKDAANGRDISDLDDGDQWSAVMNLNVGDETAIDGSSVRCESPTSFRVVAPPGVTDVDAGAVFDDPDPSAALLQAKAYAALGPGPALTVEQDILMQRLLAAESADWYGADGAVIEELEGYGEHSGLYDAERVAQRLGESADSDGDDAFSFGFDSNAEGEIGGYTVGVFLKEHGGYYIESHDAKHLNPDRGGYGFDGTDYYHYSGGEKVRGKPPEQSGLRRTIVIAETIDGDYRRTRAKAEQLGLIAPRDRV